jgi:hypothetical protein
MITSSASPVNSDPVTQKVAGVPGNPNRLPELEGENDRYQARFAKAVETIVGCDPDIALAVLKNSVHNIVA